MMDRELYGSERGYTYSGPSRIFNRLIRNTDPRKSSVTEMIGESDGSLIRPQDRLLELLA